MIFFALKSWYMLLRMFNVTATAHIPLDEHVLNLYEKNDDATVYWTIASNVAKFREENKSLATFKAILFKKAYLSLLYSAYCMMFFSVLVLAG